VTEPRPRPRTDLGDDEPKVNLAYWTLLDDETGENLQRMHYAHQDANRRRMIRALERIADSLALVCDILSERL
jgi:hypothetical protein